MKESRRKYPVKEENPPAAGGVKVVAAGRRTADWPRPIRKPGKEWPARGVKLPTAGDAVAAVAVAVSKQFSRETHSNGVCFFFYA